MWRTVRKGHKCLLIASRAAEPTLTPSLKNLYTNEPLKSDAINRILIPIFQQNFGLGKSEREGLAACVAREKNWGWCRDQDQFQFNSVQRCSFSAAAGPSPLQQTPGPSPLQTPSAPIQVEVTQDSVEKAQALRMARAIKRGIRISPKKLTLVAKLVRRMHVEDAMNQCRLLPKKAARIVERVVRDACFNAENNHGLDVNQLQVDECFVTPGQQIKRLWPHGRGKTGVRRHRFSHLTVKLIEKDGLKPKLIKVQALKDRPRKSRTFVGVPDGKKRINGRVVEYGPGRKRQPNRLESQGGGG